MKPIAACVALSLSLVPHRLHACDEEHAEDVARRLGDAAETLVTPRDPPRSFDGASRLMDA